MTLQEFKDRALEIFPGANVGGVTKDRHEPSAPLLVGLINTTSSDAITFGQLKSLSYAINGAEIEIKADADPEPGMEGFATLHIRVTL
jgi:hypothetical protein